MHNHAEWDLRCIHAEWNRQGHPLIGAAMLIRRGRQSDWPPHPPCPRPRGESPWDKTCAKELHSAEVRDLRRDCTTGAHACRGAPARRQRNVGSNRGKRPAVRHPGKSRTSLPSREVLPDFGNFEGLDSICPKRSTRDQISRPARAHTFRGAPVRGMDKKRG